MKTHTELGAGTFVTGLVAGLRTQWVQGVMGAKHSLVNLVMVGVMLIPGVTLGAGPAPVDLGTAGHFTILSGAAITSTGGGTIVGDVGAYPIAGSGVGIPPPQVTGIIYERDATGTAGPNVVIDASLLLTAKNDLTTAYNDAAGRTFPILNPGGGNLGGLNLVPGLYKITTTALITGSDLTLTGGPNDVWIFQCDQDLQLGSGINVILAGGAQAGNIFWQVTSSAVLGTSSSMKGTIMADQSVTMNTSSTLEGRALASVAGITFNGNSGSLPTVILTVLASPTNGGSVTGSGTFLIGSTNPITATPSNTWEFVAWNDGDTNGTRNIILLSNTTYTAFFVNTNLAQVTLAVLATPTNGGAVTGSGSYLVGTPVPITATASNGWRFSQWDDGVTNSSRTVVVPLGGATNTATFVAWTTRIYFQETSCQVASWTLDAAGNFLSAAVVGDPGKWRNKAVGDIDGDGVGDLLFQSVSGQIAVWLMNANGTVKGYGYLGTVGAWVLCACGDYDGDGRPELFFQDPVGNVAYWQIDTNGVCTNSVLVGNTGGWKLKVATDVDGDGKADLFWQTQAGTVAAWYHNGPGGSIQASLVGLVDGWRLVGATDIDGDGSGDLLWQSPDMDVAAWIMNANGTMRNPLSWGKTPLWLLQSGGN